MTVRTVKLGGTDWEDGQVLYAGDLNDTMDAISLKEEYTTLIPNCSSQSLTDESMHEVDVSAETNLFGHKMFYHLTCYQGSSNTNGVISIKATFTDATTQTDVIGTVSGANDHSIFIGTYNYTKQIEKIEILGRVNNVSYYIAVRQTTTNYSPDFDELFFNSSYITIK